MSEETLNTAMLNDRREAARQAQRLALYARLEQTALARQAAQEAVPGHRRPARPRLRTSH
jgi:hypothetical protein